MVPPFIVDNTLPDGQVWGDGRILWVESASDGTRRVLQGTLTTGELEALLASIVEAGFFGWEDLYGDFGITDQPTQCLLVHLNAASKSVCEYYQGAPEHYDALYLQVAAGAGAAGVDYVPERAYLKVYLQEFHYPPDRDKVAVWPAETLGVSLAAQTQGVWVEGEALALAWRIVNAGAWGSLAREGEDYYHLGLLVPGLSYVQPPSQ
jgi:hypothetical protein